MLDDQILMFIKSLLCSLFSTVADGGCDHDEVYTNIQHFYGNSYEDGTDDGVFQVRECQNSSLLYVTFV